MEREQTRFVGEVRRNRDQAAAQAALERLKKACADPNDNVMPHLIACVKTYLTEGEIVEAMAGVYGRYTEKVAF